MGYAISSQVAVPILNDLATNGYVTRPWLGVRLYEVNETVVLRLNLAVDQGILVTAVVSGAPADLAGIQAGDVITQFDGTDVATLDDLTKAIRAHKVGETVAVTYWRGKTQNTTNVTLEQSPPPTP